MRSVSAFDRALILMFLVEAFLSAVIFVVSESSGAWSLFFSLFFPWCAYWQWSFGLRLRALSRLRDERFVLQDNLR